MLEDLKLFFSPDIWKRTDEAAAKFHWVLKLRWVALTFQLLSIFPGLHFGFLKWDNLAAFILVIGIMAAINIGSIFFLEKRKQVTRSHLFVQLALDLFAIAILLYLTGGLKNPFTSLLLFHAALGPLLLTAPWNFPYFGFLILAIAFLYFAPPPAGPLTANSHSIVILFSQIIVAFAIWQFTTWLSRTLFAFRKHVHQLEQHENRMDRLRAVGALASGFSHEFATPLNVLKLRLGRLARKLEETSLSESIEDVQVAEDAIHQCETSLRNLLKAQVDSNTYSLQRIPISAFIRRICDSWILEHPNSKIAFSTQQPEENFCLIPQLALSQTILNILDNSFQAHPESSIAVDIANDERWVTLRIADSGPGIPDIILEKIGEPFLTTKSDGTGLGLYNAFNLLEAIGGKLEVNNLAPQGAEVKLLFPREAEG
jgi:two-component system sensor histidine kinase RegB